MFSWKAEEHLALGLAPDDDDDEPDDGAEDRTRPVAAPSMRWAWPVSRLPG